MVDRYANYDYAWKQRGWEVQNPTLALSVGLSPYGDLGLPSDVSKVLVEGAFLDPISGRGLEGVLQFRTSDILVYTTTNAEVMPGVMTVRFTDSDPLYVELAATDDAQLTTDNPTGWKYHFRLTVQGVTREFTSALPAIPATVKIWDLIG